MTAEYTVRTGTENCVVYCVKLKDLSGSGSLAVRFLAPLLGSGKHLVWKAKTMLPSLIVITLLRNSPLDPSFHASSPRSERYKQLHTALLDHQMRGNNKQSREPIESC
jgi:hypothetical protein